jgi:hypothetical protein
MQHACHPWCRRNRDEAWRARSGARDGCARHGAAGNACRYARAARGTTCRT